MPTTWHSRHNSTLDCQKNQIINYLTLCEGRIQGMSPRITRLIAVVAKHGWLLYLNRTFSCGIHLHSVFFYLLEQWTHPEMSLKMISQFLARLRTY